MLAFVKGLFPFSNYHRRVLILSTLEIGVLDCDMFLPRQLAKATYNWRADAIFKENGSNSHVE